MRTHRLTNFLERPDVSTERIHACEHRLREGRPVMMIVVVPFWLWLAALPVLFTIRVASMVVRTLVVSVRLSWQLVRAVVSRKASA